MSASNIGPDGIGRPFTDHNHEGGDHHCRSSCPLWGGALERVASLADDIDAFRDRPPASGEPKTIAFDDPGVKTVNDDGTVSVRASGGPSTARRLLGQLLGRHHREMLRSGDNCAACHNYPVNVDRVYAAIEAEARATPPALDVERLRVAMRLAYEEQAMTDRLSLAKDIPALVAAEYDRMTAAARLSASGESPEPSGEKRHG